MKNVIILLILISGLKPIRQHKEVTGKWVVDKVDVRMPPNISSKEKQILNTSFIKPFTNAVFDFKPDHHMSLSADIKGMPKPDSWEYDAVKELITIKHSPDGVIMKIRISEEGGSTFFYLAETPVVLKVHKKLD